ncbi:phosphotransferase system IIB component, partial [Caulobacter segnis]|nr:phosphotransferase system IIB component [Caulobacter segnis]
TVAGEIRAALGAPPPKAQAQTQHQAQAQPSQAPSAPSAQDEAKAKAILAALGGPANLREVSASSSRLRLLLQKPANLDEPALANAGARGCVHITDTLVHVVLGPDADAVGRAIQEEL